MKKEAYPLLDINLHSIYENAKTIVNLCMKHDISVAGVFKGIGGNIDVAKKMIDAGCKYIASSRIEQLAHAKKSIGDCETMLLRLPMFCEIDDAILYADISLNSEFSTIMRIEEECEKLGKKHKVVMMADLGDLREGYIDYDELIDTAIMIERELKNVELAGVGTNLGCYGSIKPTVENLGLLCDIAQKIENAIGRELEIISGGATSSLPLVLSGEIPKKINNLRVGEAILNNMDLPLIWGFEILGMNQDTLRLRAQIIEIKEKPSHPIGEIFIDAFGNKPHYEDIGVRKRALLGVGRQDFSQYDKLIPEDTAIKVIGSSSDHLIIDITDSSEEYKVGDIISFKLFYGPMLYLSSSDYVNKRKV